LLLLGLSSESLPVFFLRLEKIFSNRSIHCFLPLTLPFYYAFFPGFLFYSAFWYPAVRYIVVLSCLLL